MKSTVHYQVHLGSHSPHPGCSPPLGCWPSSSGCCSGWCWLWHLTWSAGGCAWRATVHVHCPVRAHADSAPWAGQGRTAPALGGLCGRGRLPASARLRRWACGAWCHGSGAAWRCACRRNRRPTARHIAARKRCSGGNGAPEGQTTCSESGRIWWYCRGFH